MAETYCQETNRQIIGTDNINNINIYLPKNDPFKLYIIKINYNGEKIYVLYNSNKPILYIKDFDECYIILPENYYENEFYRKEIDRIYENELGNDKVMMINKLENGFYELIIFKIDVTDLLYSELQVSDNVVEEELIQLYKDKHLDKLFTDCIEIYSRKLLHLDNPYYNYYGTKYLRRVFLPNLQKLTYKMFDDYTNIEKLDISNCKKFEEYSLRGLNLKSIINTKVEELENSVYEGCFGDGFVIANKHLHSIDPYAFSESDIEILILHNNTKKFDLSSIQNTNIGIKEPLIIPPAIEFCCDAIFRDAKEQHFIDTATSKNPYHYDLNVKILVCLKEYKEELNNYFNKHFYNDFKKEYAEYFDVPFDKIFIPDINFKNIVVLPNIKLTYGNLSIYPYLNNNAKTIINTLVLIQNRLSTTSLYLPKEIYLEILSFIEIFTLQTNNI